MGLFRFTAAAGLFRSGLLACGAAIIAGSIGTTAANASERHIAVDVMLCAPGCAPTQFHVWDGDTFRTGFGPGSVRVRLARIDAPELDGQCRSEIDLARQSKLRLAELLNGRRITVKVEGTDAFGRTLATIFAEGVDVGGVLVGEGLARHWTGRRQPWCG